MVVDSHLFLPICPSARTFLAHETSRQRPTITPGELESSPRPGARDGMKQEPYELRSSATRSRSKGEATHGDSQHHAFPGFTKIYEVAASGRSVLRRGLVHTSRLPQACTSGENYGRQRNHNRKSAGRPSVRREIHQGSRWTRSRALASRDVYRLDQRNGLAPSRLGSRRQFRRRSHGWLCG